MEKNLKIVIFLGVVILVLYLLLVTPIFFREKKSATAEICIKDKCFSVEVVKTTSEMEKGLMFRDHLDKDRGMLFVFDKEGYYPFWMKNTLIPLDIIWINQDQKVVSIKENAEPCRQVNCPTINPSGKTKYVLEVNGGIVHEINLKVGDKITFSL